jgi:hypothetical protein
MSRHAPRSTRPKAPAPKPSPTFLIVRLPASDRAKFARVCAKAGSTMSGSIRTFIDIRIGKEIKP